MAIRREDGVREITVGELMDEDLRIPPYQRPYRWDPATALQLLDDIHETFEGSRDARDGVGDTKAISARSYVLGAVILHRDRDTGELNVIDGQQRILTLLMIRDVLAGALDGSVAAGEDPTAAVVRARQAIAQRTNHLAAEASELLAFINTQCELIRVETDDPDEAFRVFDSQNYRGKALLPHDLLRAYHLREMRDESESMQMAIVEGWQSVPDEELDRLFSTYLWRIRRWSRGLSAPAFANQHVEAFKGLTTSSAGTPSARYHLAAQAAVPMLSAWSGVQSEDAVVAAGRSRFQLDAPVLAGRAFFEMVTFMLAELRRLRREAFEVEGWDAYASTDADLREISSKSRYRYVSEMYLASLLYYTNKFGTSGVREAKQRLFTWAFSMRTRLRRVQLVSVNNYASSVFSQQSAFVLLRNAEASVELRQLDAGSLGRDQEAEFEADLVQLLRDVVA